ncbi:hypothetical protein CMI37_10520 [Candidatus Pacearchaeota archaeon]|nr:hypothetical protein [Candidatus Pacearchaeota archaeon]
MNSIVKKKRKKSGRPTSDTPETRQKIEQAAALDASVAEIAFYAGISRETYYQIIKKDKTFSDRIEALRNKPVLKARQTIVQGLDQPDTARWFLERKRKAEFSHRTELTGPDGKDLIPSAEEKEAADRALEDV